MKSKKMLAITLGHGSSVMWYDGVNKPIAYEEERFSKIKGDSNFPINALKEVEKLVGDSLNHSNLIVSHWYDIYNLEAIDKENQYCHGIIDELMIDYSMNLITNSDKFTHHDAHRASAYAFFRNNGGDISKDNHIVVADGFGNKKEVISVYKNNKLIFRSNDYKYSLGLMYQYATSFVGMKENQDEYKFLGYEALIRDNFDALTIRNLLSSAIRLADDMFFGMMDGRIGAFPLSTHFINTYELDQTKKHWNTIFDKTLKSHGIHQDGHFNRIIIGAFIQKIVEHFMERLVNHFQIKTFIGAGGVFYNVKLNNTILYDVDKISIMPLAGDLGCSIGFYENFIGTFEFHDIAYGYRNLIGLSEYNNGKDIVYTNDYEFFVATVQCYLDEGKIVNVVTGDMEFGPRALCNTSTIAVPSRENADYINRVNNRNEVMPFAPVVTRDKSIDLFGENEKIIGSDKYMIIARRYECNVDNIKGVAHNYPYFHGYSGRPQVVTQSHHMFDIVKEFDGILINTSFNTHGTPILFNSNDIITDFFKQKEMDGNKRIVLVIFDEKN